MEYDTVLFRGSSGIISLFMPVLQKGFYISSSEGRSVYSFLTNDCGISDTYITDKIKTILIDGGPVDDIFNTEIKNMGVCALSGAMPGIVGAMMRIGSPYAAMRESITVKPVKSSESGKKIIVELKLFNAVLADLGLDFLGKGIIIDRERAADLLKKKENDSYSDCREIVFNGSPVNRGSITGDWIFGKSGLVIIKVEIENENNS